MREHEDAGEGVAELLGHTIKAIEGTISISPKRACRLRDAMLHVSRLQNMSGMALEVILGHAGFCLLVRRCLLSVFGRAYAQCDENLGMLRFSCCWWPFQTCEDLGIRTFGVLTPRHALMPHTHPAGRSDRSLKIGRLEESWRWKLTGGIGPGPRELALADVSEDVVNGKRKKCFEEIAFTIIVAPCLLWPSRRFVRSIWFLVIVWRCRMCLGRDGLVTHVF